MENNSEKRKKKKDDTKNAKLLIYFDNEIRKAKIFVFVLAVLLIVLIILELTGLIDNKIKAYELYAENDNFKCEKALLVKQHNNYVFSSCTLIFKNDNISKNDIKEVKLISDNNFDIDLSKEKDEVKFNKKIKKIDNLRYQIKYYDNDNLIIENIKMNIAYLNNKLSKK